VQPNAPAAWLFAKERFQPSLKSGVALKSLAASRPIEALVLEKPRKLVLTAFQRPEIGGGGLLRVLACGLCGTDHEQYSGVLPAPYPFIPGHEIVGTIEEIDPSAAERLGAGPGDLVALDIFQSCRACPACDSKDFRSCKKHGLLDTYGFVSTKKEPGLWGGYSQYVYLTPDAVVHKVPAGLDPVEATLFNPLGAGIRWATKLPCLREGETVAVLGPGIRGICAVAAVKEAGAGFVMVTGKGARDRDRLEWARRFGADLVVDVEREDPVASFKKATGGLANVVVDVTAKAPAVLAQAIALTAPGGRIVLAGTKGAAEAPGFVPDILIYKEITIIGALGVDSASYEEALALLAQKKYPFSEIPRESAGLEDAEALIQKMAGDQDQQPPLHAVIEPR
jgi:alcohol dehydrogenase